MIGVGDDYPDGDIFEAFKGQEAVVLAYPWSAYVRDSAMIDASIKAGVRRLVVSTYGPGDNDPKAAGLFMPTKHTIDIVAELKLKEAPGWSWTSVANGPFFDL